MIHPTRIPSRFRSGNYPFVLIYSCWVSSGLPDSLLSFTAPKNLLFTCCLQAYYIIRKYNIQYNFRFDKVALGTFHSIYL